MTNREQKYFLRILKENNIYSKYLMLIKYQINRILIKEKTPKEFLTKINLSSELSYLKFTFNITIPKK